MLLRALEIFVRGLHVGALQKAGYGLMFRGSATTPQMRRASGGSTTGGVGSQTVTLTIPSFVQDKKKLTFVAGGLAAIVLVLAVLVATKKPSGPAVAGESVAATAAPATAPASPPPAEPTKVATAPVITAPVPAPAPSEPKKDVPPDAKVLAPAPTQVPAAAPATTAKTDPKAVEAAKAEGAKALADPNKPADASKAAPVDPGKAVLQATLFLNISPWGEVFENGRSQGVSPPKKFVKLDPGKYKIEVRNTTFPVHAQNLEVKAREEVTLTHRFQ
jgi:outer membrane biosynthesis protein TonB